MKIGIHSETGHLQKVIVHTPGHEVSLVNPDLAAELLFDDIIFEEDARREHLDMLKMFDAAMPEDGEIFQILDLARDVLKGEDARAFFVEKLVRSLPEKNIHLIRQELEEFSSEELVRFIVEGTVDPAGGFTLLPLPNLLFTRDLAAVAGGDIIVARLAKRARIRESILMETIVCHHPLFDSVKDEALFLGGNQTVEGGDILVINENIIVVGMSERTTFNGLITVSEKLLNNSVSHVIAVDIPKQRSSMHLDTIITVTDHNECVVFPPVIEHQTENVVILSKPGESITVERIPSLKQALEELTGAPFRFISCGGSDPADQYREQWTDGANIFALAPGVITGYERNTKTFNELVDNGYTFMDQFEFIEKFTEKPFIPEDEGKIAITFHGHELCRGRGGARCMTLPLLRKKLI